MLRNCEKCKIETPFIIPKEVCNSCTNDKPGQSLKIKKKIKKGITTNVDYHHGYNRTYKKQNRVMKIR